MYQHRKVSLFILEILMSIFILSVSAAACIHVFAIAYEFRQNARESRQAKELFATTAELLSASGGDSDIFFSMEPNGEKTAHSLIYYYTKNMETCSLEEAYYILKLCFSQNPESAVDIKISRTRDQTDLCSQTFHLHKQRIYQSEGNET